MQFEDYTIKIMHGQRFTPDEVIQDMDRKSRTESGSPNIDASVVNDITADFKNRIEEFLQTRGLRSDTEMSSASTEGHQIVHILREFDEAIKSHRIFSTSAWTYF